MGYNARSTLSEMIIFLAIHRFTLLRVCGTRSQCVSLAPPRAPLKLSLALHSVSHAFKTM